MHARAHEQRTDETQQAASNLMLSAHVGEAFDPHNSKPCLSVLGGCPSNGEGDDTPDCLNTGGGPIAHASELEIAPPPSPLSRWEFESAASPFAPAQSSDLHQRLKYFILCYLIDPACVNFFYIYCGASVVFFWLQKKKTFEMQIDAEMKRSL